MSFGYISFFSGSTPISSVKCKNHCTVLKIFRKDFLKIMESHPTEKEKFYLIKDDIEFGSD